MRAVFVGLILIGAALAALARDNGQYAQVDAATRRWFQQQVVPPGNGNVSGYACCSIADAEQVEEDIRDGHYWIRSEHFPEWTRVPDTLVIRDPNKLGRPIVWWSGPGDGFESESYEIRCYAPGAGL